MKKRTYIDGIGSSQAIDTAGEVVDLAGLDCSSLIGGAFNYEHKSDLPAQIVGKVLDYKKIFSDKDCDTDRHKHFWSKCQIPFLYVSGRLFDDKKESSKEIAALFEDDAENPNEKPMVGFSVEGAKIEKVGMVITRSIARKITITHMPANKTCVAESLPKTKTTKDDLDSIFKTEPGEVEFFNPNSNYLEFLHKKEEGMSKTARDWTGPKKTANAFHFHHPEHGTLTIHKQPSGEFHVKHNGALAGLKGTKGTFGSAGEAGKHAKAYMSAVSSGSVGGSRTHNNPSPAMSGKSEMNKAMDAGSSLAAPAQLTQGAALAKEDLEKGNAGIYEQTGVHLPPLADKKGGTSVMGTHVRNPSDIGSGSKEMARRHAKSNLSKLKSMPKPKLGKSEWLQRAEKAYDTWEKREDFEKFMKSRLPHLTKGEIKAIGQVVALKKSVGAEKNLSKMFSSYYEKNEIPTSQNECNEPGPELEKVESLPEHGSKPKAPDFDSSDHNAKIGTTRSGKAIHNNFEHPAHKGFKAPDHRDAEALHNNFKRHHGNEWHGHAGRGKIGDSSAHFNLGGDRPDHVPGESNAVREAAGKKIQEHHRSLANASHAASKHHAENENAHRAAQGKKPAR